ncbi:MAG: AGE family epimerase/isomerase [Balneolales bacterium]
MLNFYKRHVEEVLLPFWSRALDHRNGGVFTCFNNAGDRLISTDKYTWSQGRFLWLWSRLARMTAECKLSGEPEPYHEHLHKTALFLDEHVFLDNGNCAFLLTENGDKKESIPGQGFDTSFYADCFVAIGMGEYAGLMQDRGRLDKALAVYKRIRDRLDRGDIRSEPYPVPDGYRAQSVPMIMLNVSQGLAEVAETLDHPESGRLLDHSIAYMRDIMDNFCLDDHHLVEMLPEDSSETGTLLYRHLNPGHAIECMWFVMHTARRTGYTGYLEKAAMVMERAARLGWDPVHGGLLRFADCEGGEPKGERGGSAYEKLITGSWDLKLWWPHSEALYASLLAGNTPLHERFRDYTFSVFPNPDKTVGEWIQIRDRQGKPVEKVAALPVKDPFHILRNMLLIIDHLS